MKRIRAEPTLKALLRPSLSTQSRAPAKQRRPTAKRRLVTLSTSSQTINTHNPTKSCFSNPWARQPSSTSSAPAGCLSSRSYSSSPSAAEPPLQKTALYDLHMEYGAKMVPFGGYSMPVQYAGESVSASHLWTRSHASLFDVGHMVQRIISGPGAAAFLERVTPSALSALAPLRGTLSCLLHRGTGGIVDDTVITRLEPGVEDGGADEAFYVVTNAACRAKDDAYLAAELEAWNADHPPVRHRKLDGWGLVALQGPLAADILSEAISGAQSPGGADDLKTLLFGHATRLRLDAGGAATATLLVSRAGYTGEDGFEISCPPEDTEKVARALLDLGSGRSGERLKWAGLGARDSLRLEAGMCLYGHDLDDTTTPAEAGLGWVVAKERREKGGFHGAEVVLPQLVPRSKGGKGVERRRVGLEVQGAPAREGAEIVGEGGKKIGVVTSGCPSPTLGKNIAMGYVRDGYHKAGTEVDVVVRGKPRKAVVTKMPFVKTQYWKGVAPT